MKIKYIAICLVLLCCIIGTASAAEDISTDIVSDSVDDAVVVDAIQEEIDETPVDTVTTEPTVSDDTTMEEIDDDIKTDEISEESAIVDSEPTRATDVNAANWGTLKTYGMSQNNYNIHLTSPTPLFGQSLLKSVLGSSVLGDFNTHDEIYVNESSSNDPFSDDIDGSSWDNAFGGEMGLLIAGMNINDGGIIHLADTTFSDFAISQKNVTVIGFAREGTIINPSTSWSVGSESTDHFLITCINMTFIGPGNIADDVTFINCTFINFTTSTNTANGINENFYNTATYSHNYDDFEDSFVTNFISCDFVNSTMNECKYTQLNFENCNFENITADFIVHNTGGFINYDAINFIECTFNNVNVKGVVDVPTGTSLADRVHIEDCIGIEGSTPITEGDRDYINTTGSRTATVLSATVDSNDNLVINLKDENENSIANADVLISVNSEDAVPYQLESDGTLSIPLADLSSSLGPISITVSFAKTNDYKASTATVDYVIRNAPSIVAEDLTTEVNVAKDLTITLLDNNNNPLVGKEIVVSVGGVNSTVTTGEGGVATIPISYDTAGVYEYTLYFAGDADTYKEATKVVTVTVTAPEPIAPTKVDTKLAAAKVTATYNVAKKLVITLTADGKALANKKVTVKVGTISKTLTTNAKGQVILNVATLVPKTYTASVKFAGDDAYLASSVSPKVVVSKAKPQIVAKAKTFKVKVKTKKYTVTLKNNKGKVLKKVKLTLKVGKKTYKATTNSKGKATFKITKLTKKGKYTATVKFAGSKYYKALSKKVKITVKK